MATDILRMLIDDRGRGDDRRSADASSDSHKPPVLRRRTLQFFYILAIIGIVYGTLTPFQIDARRTWSWDLGWHPMVYSDAAANVLIYMPVGLLARLCLRRRGSRPVAEIAGALVAAGGLSYLTEAAQTMLAGRVACWNDVICNTAGAVVGILFAPLVQRVVRNQHAWLYHELRQRPFSAAAAGWLIVLLGVALTPLDLRPTPAHVLSGSAHVRAVLHEGWGEAWLADRAWRIPGEGVDKLLAAATYGLLAFLLVPAAREKRCSALSAETVRPGVLSAMLHALSRAAGLAVAVEVLQLFTVSHVADPRDLAMSVAAALVGSALGGLVAAHGWTTQPMRVLWRIAALMAFAGLLRMTLSSIPSSHPGDGGFHLWPMAAGFHRSWSGLLGVYLMNFVQYSAVGGLIVIWLRACGRRPSAMLLVALMLGVASADMSAAILIGRAADTTPLLIAALAGFVLLRLDRAFLESAPRIELQQSPPV